MSSFCLIFLISLRQSSISSFSSLIYSLLFCLISLSYPFSKVSSVMEFPLFLFLMGVIAMGLSVCSCECWFCSGSCGFSLSLSRICYASWWRSSFFWLLFLFLNI